MITKETISYILTPKAHAKDADGVCWTTHYVMGELARLRGCEYYPVVMRCEEHNSDDMPKLLEEMRDDTGDDRQTGNHKSETKNGIDA